MTAILQWNLRGLDANYQNLQLLITDYSPSVICLQETKLKEDEDNIIRGYKGYHKMGPPTINGLACGGASIYVKNHTPQDEIILDTNLQAVAVRVTLDKTMTVCCLYRRPSVPVSKEDLTNLYNQLPQPVVFLGDFNAHNIIWGDNHQDDYHQGEIVENFINDHNLCLLNDGRHTYLHPNGTTTAIDLTLCDPDLFLSFKWDIDNDVWGSDHYPIFIRSTIPLPEENVPKWRLHKADWTKFKDLCEEEIRPELFVDVEDSIELFTNILYSIAERTIPKSSTKPKKTSRPWFNDECKEAIKTRKNALRQFNRQPTEQNLQHFKIW